jgi:hypothetical protein
MCITQARFSFLGGHFSYRVCVQLTVVFPFRFQLYLYLLEAYGLQLAAVFALGFRLYLLAACSVQLGAVFPFRFQLWAFGCIPYIRTFSTLNLRYAFV